MKCSIGCKFYTVYTHADGYEVCCAIRGFTIKDIKNKFPETYLNCPKYQEVRSK